MVTSDEKILLDLTYAEYEGIGTWYEYLAKSRVFKKIAPKTVLLAGLPQEYGLASDILLFAMKGSSVTVIDDREDKLEEFVNLAKKFKIKNIKKVLLKDFLKFPFENDSFDLVTNTEALQRAKDPKKMILEMERVSKKHVFVFAPNSYYYAHYLITKIGTFKLSQLIDYSNLKIEGKGYVDKPPWPAGVAISSSKISFTQGSKAQERKKSEATNKKDNLLISLIKSTFILFTPILVRLDALYLPPLRELLSHMCYVHLVK
jgi:hypothetical protein